MFKDRDGKLNMARSDYNLSLGNANYPADSAGLVLPAARRRDYPGTAASS
jgi:hypothetical protein